MNPSPYYPSPHYPLSPEGAPSSPIPYERQIFKLAQPSFSC